MFSELFHETPKNGEKEALVPRSRMRGAILPFPQYIFMAWCLVKHRDNFTFTFRQATRKERKRNYELK
jgi:hypothetical protein